MNKYIKIGAIIGGVWGLISGILYAFGGFLAGFSDRGDFGGLFNNVPAIGRILLLPAFLTYLISSLLGNSFAPASFLGFFFIFIWCIGIPILIGVVICTIISYYWQNFGKQ